MADHKENELFSGKMLRAMIVPLCFEQLLAMLVGMADTLVVSYVGEAAVSGADHKMFLCSCDHLAVL